MKKHSSTRDDFSKQKELITKSGKLQFNNKNTNIDSKGKTKSQQKWLRRQMNDPYVFASKLEGYISRAAYKIIEVQSKYHIIEPKMKTIIDLGSAPGSWSQVILTDPKLVGKKVIGVDILPMKFKHKDLTFIQGDFENEEIQKQIVQALNGKKADCIICDIAMNAVGNAEIDRLRSERIIELALWFAGKYLARGGHFLCKAIKGADNEVFKTLQSQFRFAHRFKPKASRKDSSEMYLVGISAK